MAKRIGTTSRKGGDKQETVRRDKPKVGRNDPCPCGSGKKYKKCHGKDEAEAARASKYAAGWRSAAPGFRFAGVAAGIKTRAGPTSALIAADAPAPAAAVFTQQPGAGGAGACCRRAACARRACRGVIVNSGNANACTGSAARADAAAMAQSRGARHRRRRRARCWWPRPA